MEEKILKYIKDNDIIKYGDRVLVGVSGGPDSVALVDFLSSIKQQFALQLFVCHLNHMLRGSEADQDEIFVKNLCKELNIPFYTRKCDIKEIAKVRKTSIEETGREERYKFFYYIKDKLGIDKIALGHHKDDNVETIFMRFLRGTGIKGLRGIVPKRADGVIRPFLCVTKKEILLYSNTKGLISRQDHTNFETDYHRNKLRLEVIPYMEKLNPNFSNNLDNLGNISNKYYDFVEYHVKCALETVIEQDKINVVKFNNLHEVIKTEILIKLINQLDNTRSVEYQHIKIIIEKLNEKNNTTWSIDLPKGIKMIRQYNLFFPQEATVTCEDNEYRYNIIPNKVYVFPKIGLTLKTEVIATEEYKGIGKSSNTLFFDYNKISQNGDQLNLRSRKNGDKIDSEGIEGTKKIKAIFIDKKIPANIRWKIPIFCIDNEVIWIVGYHRSRKFKISNETKDILKISYYNHEEEKNE